MKNWRLITALLLGLVLTSVVACSPMGGDEGEGGQQMVKVERGDLIVSVSGSGNIEVDDEINMTFGVAGKIDRINVEDGDKVEKGTLLAALDTDALKLVVTQAQLALTQQQVAVTQAELGLRVAEHSLDEARDIYTWPEIKEMQEDVKEAKAYVDYVSDRLDSADSSGEEAQWTATLQYAWARLEAAEAKLDARIMSYDTEEVNIKKMEVALAEESLELAKQSLGQAQQSLENAQKNLDEATLTAPFSGVAATVYVDEGDTISPASPIIHLVDLSHMELKMEVDEIDIPDVEIGQKVIIEVDALPDVDLVGSVISISALSVERGGVVLYEVTIGFDVSEGSKLRAGMSADVDIVMQEKSNVLIVPNRAITRDSGDNAVVKVMVGKDIEERTVITGISDGFDTEIISGLNAGDTVVMGG